MEKPVRIIATEKMRTFNEKVRNGLEHALNFMLGGEGNAKIAINGFEPFLMPIETYISAYKKKSILIKLRATKAYEGELYWFFEMKSAVVLGGLLRMLPLSALKEKVEQGTFDATDQDAFGEVGNQLSGILDRAFRTLTSKNVHLRMDFNKKVYPDEAIELSSFINKEEYVVLLSTITIPEQGPQKLTLLLPRTLYEVLLNLEIQLEGITTKNVLIYSWDPERIEKMQMALNSRYVKVIPLSSVEDVLVKLDQPNMSAAAFDLRTLTFPLSHQDNILFKRLQSNRNFGRLPSFISWEGSTEDGVKELKRMGFAGANTGTLLTAFPAWVQPFTKP